MITAAASFSVPIQCLFPGCPNEETLVLHPRTRGALGIDPPPSWLFYALGFPSTRKNLGLCPDHQHVVLAGRTGEPDLDVLVRAETHGLFYELRQHGELLGKVTFPTNTLTLQFAPVEASDRLRIAGNRVAIAFGFLTTS
jgi:hypothetical protein